MLIQQVMNMMTDESFRQRNSRNLISVLGEYHPGQKDRQFLSIFLGVPAGIFRATRLNTVKIRTWYSRKIDKICLTACLIQVVLSIFLVHLVVQLADTSNGSEDVNLPLLAHGFPKDAERRKVVVVCAIEICHNKIVSVHHQSSCASQFRAKPNLRQASRRKYTEMQRVDIGIWDVMQKKLLTSKNESVSCLLNPKMYFQSCRMTIKRRGLRMRILRFFSSLWEAPKFYLVYILVSPSHFIGVIGRILNFMRILNHVHSFREHPDSCWWSFVLLTNSFCCHLTNLNTITCLS